MILKKKHAIVMQHETHSDYQGRFEWFAGPLP